VQQAVEKAEHGNPGGEMDVVKARQRKDGEDHPDQGQVDPKHNFFVQGNVGAQDPKQSLINEFFETAGPEMFLELMEEIDGDKESNPPDRRSFTDAKVGIRHQEFFGQNKGQ